MSGVDRLRSDVARATRRLELTLEGVLARHGLGPRQARNRTVAAALGRWDSPAARAEALADGSAADAVYDEAVDRWPDALDAKHDRELLAIDLDLAARRASSAEGSGPSEAVLETGAASVRRAIATMDRKDGDRGESASRERAAAMAAKLPEGVPMLPTPGLWYATINAWHVQVRGSYARFVVSVPQGAPDRLPADLRYVRENRTVRLDVDGDGTDEVLGRNRRLTFAAGTVVGVAVPPRPRGVGDVGERDERSSGWPEPGPAGRK